MFLKMERSLVSLCPYVWCLYLCWFISLAVTMISFILSARVFECGLKVPNLRPSEAGAQDLLVSLTASPPGAPRLQITGYALTAGGQQGAEVTTFLWRVSSISCGWGNPWLWGIYYIYNFQMKISCLLSYAPASNQNCIIVEAIQIASTKFGKISKV